MKYFMAFISIPNPNPPSNPVMNLSVLLLFLLFRNCVTPSIAAGISNITANVSNGML